MKSRLRRLEEVDATQHGTGPSPAAEGARICVRGMGRAGGRGGQGMGGRESFEGRETYEVTIRLPSWKPSLIKNSLRIFHQNRREVKIAIEAETKKGE